MDTTVESPNSNRLPITVHYSKPGRPSEILRSLAISFDRNWCCEKVFEKAEREFVNCYPGLQKSEGLWFKQLQTAMRADLSRSETIGEHFQGIHKGEDRVLWMVTGDALARCSILAGSALWPVDYKGPDSVEYTQEEWQDLMRRRGQQDRYGADLSQLTVDQPVESRERDTAGVQQGVEERRIGEDGFAIPPRVKRPPISDADRTAKRRRLEPTPVSSPGEGSSQSTTATGLPSEQAGLKPSKESSEPQARAGLSKSTSVAKNGSQRKSKADKPSQVAAAAAAAPLRSGQAALMPTPESPESQAGDGPSKSAFAAMNGSQGKKNRGQTWSVHEDRLILRGLRKSMSNQQIIETYKLRGGSSFRNRKKVLTVRYPNLVVPVDDPRYEAPEVGAIDGVVKKCKAKHPRWTLDEDRKVKQAMAEGYDAKEIADRYFPIRTVEALSKKYRSFDHTVRQKELREDDFPKDDTHVANWSNLCDRRLRRAMREGLTGGEAQDRWFHKHAISGHDFWIKWNAYERQLGREESQRSTAFPSNRTLSQDEIQDIEQNWPSTQEEQDEMRSILAGEPQEMATQSRSSPRGEPQRAERESTEELQKQADSQLEEDASAAARHAKNEVENNARPAQQRLPPFRFTNRTRGHQQQPLAPHLKVRQKSEEADTTPSAVVAVDRIFPPQPDPRKHSTIQRDTIHWPELPLSSPNKDGLVLMKCGPRRKFSSGRIGYPRVHIQCLLKATTHYQTLHVRRYMKKGEEWLFWEEVADRVWGQLSNYFNMCRDKEKMAQMKWIRERLDSEKDRRGENNTATCPEDSSSDSDSDNDSDVSVVEEHPNAWPNAPDPPNMLDFKWQKGVLPRMIAEQLCRSQLTGQRYVGPIFQDEPDGMRLGEAHGIKGNYVEVAAIVDDPAENDEGIRLETEIPGTDEAEEEEEEYGLPTLPSQHRIIEEITPPTNDQLQNLVQSGEIEVYDEARNLLGTRPNVVAGNSSPIMMPNTPDVVATSIEVAATQTSLEANHGARVPGKYGDCFERLRAGLVIPDPLRPRAKTPVESLKLPFAHDETDESSEDSSEESSDGID